MPTDTQTYGFVRFQTFSAFVAGAGNISVEHALRMLDKRSDNPLRSPPITDWPRIIDCIQRGTEFSLTARTPALHASISFDTAIVDPGAYEIHVPHERRHESGVVVTVNPIQKDELQQPHYAMLAPFPIRFAVLTRSASDRQGTRQIWLIGITAVRAISPESLISLESTNDA